MKYLTLLLLLCSSPAAALTLPSATEAHYSEDVAAGYAACARVIDIYGHRSLTHGTGSMLDRLWAERSCEVAVEVAHKVGLRGEVVRYYVAAWGVQESNWSAAASGDNTELGPLQIKANTCRDAIGRRCRAKDGLVVHVAASLKYLDFVRQFGNGSWYDALAAYRAGPGAWSCVRRNSCTESNWAGRRAGIRYSSQVLARVAILRGAAR